MTIESSARDLAARLMLHETGDTHDPAQLVDAADRICQKLQERFTIYIGQLGFQAVLSRALRLSQREHPFLSGIESVQEDGGTLKGLPQSFQALSYAQAKDATQALIANIFRTLIELVGWDFVLGIVSAAWPEVSPDSKSSLPPRRTTPLK